MLRASVQVRVHYEPALAAGSSPARRVRLLAARDLDVSLELTVLCPAGLPALAPASRGLGFRIFLID
jgi:hypothetical protein